MPVSREEYIAQYGIDPETGASAATAPAPEEGGGVWDHLKGLVVGAASAPTDLYALPSVALSGGQALYRSYANDTKFLDEFRKDLQIDDAQANIQKHLQSVADQWKQRDPSLTEEQINSGLQDYTKSKQYEDFTQEQLTHFPYVAAKWKDTVRGVLGDERPDSQRKWTESAAEVLGGAVVGGPGGWATGVASAGSKVGGITAKIANSAITRGALNTAEILTPVTVPYTGANIALNAGVGLAMDQGMRAVQGKDTAFTPENEHSAGIGTIAATGVGVAGFAAFVGAVKGRSAAAIRNATPSPTAAALKNNPTLDPRVSDPIMPGGPLIRGGPDPQYGPPSSLDAMNPLTAAKRKGEGLLMDEGAPVYQAVKDIHGADVAYDLELKRMDASYAVLNDTIPSDVSNAMRNVHNLIEGMNPDEQRAMLNGWWLTSDAAQNRIRHSEALAEEAALQAKIANPQTTPQGRTTATTRLAELQSDIQRFTLDQRSARPRIPDVPMVEGQNMANTFLNDMSPNTVKFRNEVKALNKSMLDLQVRSGELSQAVADEMHRLNPYYVRAVNDPLKGKTGVSRMWESISQGINRSLERSSEGAGASTLHESPLRHLDKGIPQEKLPGAPETRITQPLEPMSAARQYVEQAYRSAKLVMTRNEHIRHLAWEDGIGANGVKTAFHTDGHMRIVNGPNGREWWTGELLRSSQVNDAMRNPRVVGEWQDGKLRLWEFGDLALAQALRMEPAQLTGMMKMLSVTSNIMKQFTTGRFAPWFAPLGAMYNTIIGIATRQPGRAFGTASYLGHRFLPKWANKFGLDALPDITVPLTWPYHLTRTIIELSAYHMTQPIVQQLIKNSPFASLQQAVGAPQFSKMVNMMLKVASWAENSPAVSLLKAGASYGHQSIDKVPLVRGAFHEMADKVPGVLKGAWQFYKDGLDAIYLADKRMYYTQNYALQHLKYSKLGQAVPQFEIDKIIREARVLAGDMAKVPASKAMKDLERVFPYLTQTKLGAYHLMRNMGSKETAAYVIPRVVAMSNMMAASYYMMTYWNAESRKEFWERTPEHQRWKYAYVPTLKLATAWASGTNLPYSRDLYYKVPIPPDIAPMVAGMTAFWQMLGAIPADATPKPIANDLFKVLTDSVTPAMPPLAQTILGASGLKLDPQSSETRGGDWIRNMVPRFKAGPQAEARTNLGQVSNSTALMMNGLLGANGAHLAAGMDVFLHASKLQPNAGGGFSPRESRDFAAGLKAATTEVYEQAKSKIPDVPLLWQNKEKYSSQTAAWQQVRENTQHIQAIVQMRNDMMGKAAQKKQLLSKMAGGVPPEQMTDVVLAQLADDVTKWQNPTGELGKLKTHYGELATQQRAVSVAYNMTQEQRRLKGNQITKMMQDNMQQQHLATKNAEELIAAKYGKYLAPRLGDRHLTISTIDQLMRESIGK
jgi:hypothetical protein